MCYLQLATLFLAKKADRAYAIMQIYVFRTDLPCRIRRRPSKVLLTGVNHVFCIIAMNKIKILCVLCFLVFGVAALFIDNRLVPVVRSSSDGPPPGMTGAPNEGNCTYCHDKNAGPGVFTVNAPANYAPGQTYQIQVQHATTDMTRLRWGFEIIALNGANAAAGTFTDTSSFTQIITDGLLYWHGHTQTGTFAGTTGGAAWSFNWTAPATDVGPVTFYAAGNQANNNSSTSGDQVYLTTTVSLGPTPTYTPTNTPTNTPTASPTPSLGNYPNTSVVLSDNVTITPDATPANTTSISVSTSTGFVGELTADPLTGVVRVTNAHHANIPPGSYTVTVKAFGPGGTNTRTFLLTVTSGTPCNVNVAFANAPDVGTPTSPFSVAIGDFNNDGKQDLAVTNQNGVAIRLGDGLGGFTGTTTATVGGSPFSVAISDFNNDGNQDFATANWNTNNVSIRLGNGLGGFSGTTEVSAGNQPYAVAIGDFNNDGNKDLAVANNLGNTVSIRLGDGLGGFSGTTELSVASPYKLAIGDFNSDGNQDLAIPSSGSNTVSIRLGDGGGNFSGTTTIMVGGNPYGVTIGDFNNDGKQDIASANFGSNSVSIRLGDGLGGFSGTTEITLNTGGPYAVAVADFNNDCNQDIAVSYGDTRGISIRLGNGLGGFSGTIENIVGSSPLSAAIGDFNADGIQDFAVANNVSNTMSIRLGACSYSIEGTVTYGNASAPPKYISNATLTATGLPTITTTTLFSGPSAGLYTLTGFGAGSYTVSLSKTTGQNSITSFDAGRIAQHVAGTLLLTTNNQKVTADVSNNGAVSSFDAGQVATFVASGSSPGIAGQWRFFLPPGPTFPVGASPTSRTYSSVTSSIAGEDYVGLLIGEVSGNWNNTGARPVGSRQLAVGGGPERGVAVELPQMVTSTYKEIIVPVNVQGATNKGIISYEFDLRYDPSVLQPLADPVDVAGTASRGLSVVTNATEPGLLRVVVYGAMPIDENGLLLNLRFTAVGKSGSVSLLSFERIMFNEGEPGVSVTDGRIELY